MSNQQDAKSEKKIGTTFGEELKSAGLGELPFSWTEDGDFWFSDGMTPEQIEAVQAVYAAHIPSDD